MDPRSEFLAFVTLPNIGECIYLHVWPLVSLGHHPVSQGSSPSVTSTNPLMDLIKEIFHQISMNTKKVWAWKRPSVERSFSRNPVLWNFSFNQVNCFSVLRQLVILQVVQNWVHPARPIADSMDGYFLLILEAQAVYSLDTYCPMHLCF